MPRPDLSIPTLPDPADLHPSPPRHSPLSSGNLRDGSQAYEWPEAGPSRRIDHPGPSAVDYATLADDESALGPVENGNGGIGPFKAKLVAAMTGAMATSLLMTPFDVLKTRLQTVQPHPRTPWIAPAEDCCQTSLLSSDPQPSSSSSRRALSWSAPSGGPQLATAAASAENPLTCITTATPSELAKPAPFASLRPSITPAAPPSGCAFPSKWAGIWGEAISLNEAMARNVVGVGMGGGGGGTATLVLPQSGAEGVMGGFWGEVGAVYRDAGVRGLWKGVGTTL